MNDFSHLEKIIVRELSCRLCLCTDVMKLKPLSAEVKRKLKRLFDIVVSTKVFIHIFSPNYSKLPTLIRVLIYT